MFFRQCNAEEPLLYVCFHALPKCPASSVSHVHFFVASTFLLKDDSEFISTLNEPTDSNIEETNLYLPFYFEHTGFVWFIFFFFM